MEQVIIGVFLAFFILEFIVEFGLNELNLRYVQARSAEQKIPDFFQAKMSAEEHDKSVRYTLAKGRFQRWSEIYGRWVMLMVLFGGVLPLMDRLSKDLASRFSSILHGEGIIFCFIIGLVFSVASLPTD